MDWVLAHLVVNHFPIILFIFGAGAALFSLAVPRAAGWSLVYASLLVGGLAAPIVLFTGKRAEEVVEEAWYVEEEVLEEHEELGEKAAWVFLAIGVAAAAAWRLEKMRPQPAPALRVAMALVALTGALLAGYTALLGGRIVHANQKLLSPSLQSQAPEAEQP